MVAGIEAPTPRNRENPQIGDSLDSGWWSHAIPTITLPIGVAIALPPIGIAGALCGLNFVKINENFDAALELLSNRKNYGCSAYWESRVTSSSDGL
ncbi:hypothetical protein CRG98_042624 [Punica granatum]|uniref:Uncharacterized protein n=1 Tax=Punica granatum TaxID=22663 RepID=A0A2I0HZ49_PUNGR|nr:hypothetical protein CRG98_042624 [Punica granatum]